MRKSALRLYAPFIGLAIVQALFVAFLPSRAPEGGGLNVGAALAPGESNFQSTTPGGSGDASGTGTTDGTFSAGTTADPGGGGTTPGTGGSAGTTGTGGSGGGDGGGGGGGGDGGGGDARPAGDTSHCKGDRQHDVIYHAPKCAPKFSGPNGGSTYQGVTEKEIKVVFFFAKPNAQVDAILESQGLATNARDRDALIAAAVDFFNKRHELYGRKITYEVFEGNCPTTPPDDAKCKEEARTVARKKPFAVVWNTPLYPPVFDEWARAGIVSLGGWHFDDAQFAGRRPFRYDVFMGGDRSAAVIADYYCKKLNGKKATHAGQIIHQSIGARGQVDRKMGIVVVERPENVASAKKVAGAVQQCSGKDVYIGTYESDINRAQEQTTAIVTGLIQSKTTTVVCMCDPIAPAFLTRGLTQQNYFPEHLVSGMGFIDYDLIGRLYDEQQWIHAFGPSHIANAIPFEQSDAARIWKAAGREGLPCRACNDDIAVYNLLGIGLHHAGPDLNPLTFERGVLGYGSRGGWEETKGRGDIVMLRFGPNDYTGVEDAREVWWNPGAISQVDGKPGAYVPVDDGRRYLVGQFTGDFKIPVAPR